MRTYTNFEDSSIGKLPTGWTRRWAMASLPAAYSATVEYGDPLVKHRELKFRTASLANVGALSYDAIDSDSNRRNFEILTSFRRPAGSPTTSSGDVRLSGRASGVTGAASSYDALLVYSDGVSGTPNTLYLLGPSGIITSMSFTPDPAAKYLMRYRVQDEAGSPTTVRLQVRVWKSTEPEPAAWTLSAIDAALYGQSGWVGLGTYGMDQFAYFNFFSVGTNGDTAWMPLTNAEYTAWLDDQTAIRRTLIEASAVGYDVAGVYGGPKYLDVVAQGSPTTVPATTGDAPASATGDLDIRVKVRLTNGYQTTCPLAAKWNPAALGKSWYLMLSTGGLLFLGWSADGNANTGGLGGDFSTIWRDWLGDFGADQDVMFRVTLDVDNGLGGYTARFYASFNDGADWTQFGVHETFGGTTAVYAANSSIRLGFIDDSTFVQGMDPGRIYLFQLFNGIEGTLVKEFDAAQAAVGASSYTNQNTQAVWTINAPTSIKQYVTSATLRNVHLSDGGFTSQAWDSPASQHYDAWVSEVPSMRSEASSALSGRADVSFGSFSVANGAVASGGPGVRDDWLRMKWEKSFVKVLYGDPTWPKHDYRLQIFGRLQQPTASQDRSRIKFEINDLLDLLREPLQRNRFSNTQAFAMQRKPAMFGAPGRIEPTATGSGLEHHVNDGPYSPFSGDYPLLYDNGAVLQGTVLDFGATWTAATDQVGQVGHGLQTNSRLRFIGSAPTGLTAGIWYYVNKIDADNYTLSKTRGGAVENITANGSSINYDYTLFWEDRESGKLTLVSNPASRILMKNVQAGSSSLDCRPSEVIATMLFEKYGLPLDYKDQESFDDLRALITDSAGIKFYDESITALDAVHRFAVGTNIIYTMSRDGRLRLARIGLPDATNVALSLEERDVKDLVLESVILPIDRSLLAVQYAQAFYRGGPFQLPITAPITTRLMYDTVLGDLWPDPSVPLDSYPNVSEMQPAGAFASFYSDSASAIAEKNRIQTLFARKLGRFRLRTRMAARELAIGQTISLTHTRLGWRSYSGVGSDRTSPENSEAFDARLAVVLGWEINPKGGPLPVTLKVLRQIPGNYPSANLN